jgi:hypothetical protein
MTDLQRLGLGLIGFAVVVVAGCFSALSPRGRPRIVEVTVKTLLAHRCICGLCGRAFALVKPPDETRRSRTNGARRV